MEPDAFQDSIIHDTAISVDILAEQCDHLIDKSVVNESRHKFMQTAVESYEQASILLGYFSKLKDFEEELARLDAKLTKHRINILSLYIDILPQDTIKSLSVPSKQTKLYQIGTRKYHKTKNYIVFDYRRKLYAELDYDIKRIDKIKLLVSAIVQLDKHYDIYDELIVALQKNSKPFQDIMCKHLSEYIYL